MGESLTRTVRAALARDGFVLVPGALGAADVARLRRAFEGAADDERGTQHVRIDAATLERAAWEALGAHPLLEVAAAEVLGAMFRVRDVHGRNPRPGHGEQGLHTDAQPRPAEAPFQVLTALWLLDPFEARNGATRVVSGSHRIPGAVPRRYAQPDARHPDEQVVTGPAGSVLLLNGHLWHSGRRNESAGPRRIAQMVVVGTEAGAEALVEPPASEP